MTDVRLPFFRPDLNDLRVVVNTRWKSSYTDMPIHKVESYYVDTALDNDTDTWQCVFGDPQGDLFALAARDSEMRVKLFGVGSTGTHAILTGVADDANYSDGSWTLTGRDYSSLATDSTVPPTHYRMVRAWSVVEQQAKLLKFPNRQLAHGKIVKKVFFTDGSESYWDFWWRLYRREQMWIWCEPDGTLIANVLNDNNHIDYYLGDFKDTDTLAIQRAHIPVEHIEVKKTTQGRVGFVHVYWHKGDNGARKIIEDPTTRGWLKRPIKVMLDTEAHTENVAKKTGLEEIFEGKVGSVEFRITIPDPGFPLRQNKNVRLRVEDIGLEGEFFVVGVRLQAGEDGFVQEIRLRERQYAITRRIPTDPKITNSHVPGPGVMASGMGASLEAGVSDMPAGWGDYYVKAAKEFHGPWDYQLFLATLLGITTQETHFQNERQNGGPGGDHYIWTPPPGGIDASTQTAHRHDEIVPEPGISLETWKTRFANEAGDGYVTVDYGVGPMQLTSIGLKQVADNRLRENFHNEFQGGRWHPEHNIWTGARYLRDCLKALVGDSGRDIDMWMGVSAYNKGPAGARLLDPYALAIKNFVYNDPGYLDTIKAAQQEATVAATQHSDPAEFAAATAADPAKDYNTPAELATLKYIRKDNPNINLSKVDWALLVGINRAAQITGLTAYITSGYRSVEAQAVLYARYKNSGFNNAYIAAKPGESNHNFGKACDVVFGVDRRRAFLVITPTIERLCGIHCPLGDRDSVHVTRVGVDG